MDLDLVGLFDIFLPLYISYSFVGNMASILEVDDSMEHTFIQVSVLFIFTSFACMHMIHMHIPIFTYTPIYAIINIVIGLGL